MTNTLITKEVVFKTAKQLTEQGIYPTQTKVRDLLGHGSMRDIGFYLRDWKTQCFSANKTAPSLQMELTSATLELDKLEYEKQNFEQYKLQTQQQIADLSAELKASEKRANKWQYQAENLQLELTAAATAQQQLLAQCQNLDRALQEKEHALAIILDDKNQLITSLRQELKETAHQAVVEAREYNHQHHEALMKVQIENMNLQEQGKILNKKIKEQEGQIMDLKLAAAPLKKALQEKEAIIAAYVSPEELESYVRNSYK